MQSGPFTLLVSDSLRYVLSLLNLYVRDYGHYLHAKRFSAMQTSREVMKYLTRAMVLNVTLPFVPVHIVGCTRADVALLFETMPFIMSECLFSASVRSTGS